MQRLTVSRIIYFTVRRFYGSEHIADVGIFSEKRFATKVANLFPFATVSEVTRDETADLVSMLEKSDVWAKMIDTMTDDQVKAVYGIMNTQPSSSYF